MVKNKIKQFKTDHYYRHMTILKFLTGFFIIAISIFFIFCFYQKQKTENNYNIAVNYIQNEEYDKAINIIYNIQNYKHYRDCETLLQQAENNQLYNNAIILFNNKQYKQAIELFNKIPDLKDSNNYLVKSKYNYALELFNDCKYDQAKHIFAELDNYKDSNVYNARCNLQLINYSKQIIYNYACNEFNNKNYKSALEDFILLGNYENSEAYISKIQSIKQK